MPVHDLGYRAWSGGECLGCCVHGWSPRAGSLWFGGESGFALMILLAWLPIVFPALGIFAFEFSATEPDLQQLIVQMMRSPSV